MTFPSDHDLIAHLLGHLDPPRRERVERALADPRRPELAARHARIADHLALYDALDAPPPPPFATLEAALPRARPARRATVLPSPRAAWALGAALAVVVAGLALLLTSGPATEGAVIGRAGEGLEIVAAGRTSTRPATGALRAGDVLTAARPAEAWLGERVRVVIDADARLELLGGEDVRLHAGRAYFEVAPGPFRVRTPHGDVKVVGTTFEVSVAGGELAVYMASGSVEVAGRTLDAGMALDASGVGSFEGRVGDWFARPVLRLAVEGGTARKGDVALRFTLENPGHVPIEVAGPEGVTAALWLQVRDPASVVRDVAVAAAGSGTGPLPSGRPLRLGPRGSTSFTLRFGRPFDAEGAYRCRAMYRPDGESPLLSEELLVEVAE
jgi:hypothetical protein